MLILRYFDIINLIKLKNIDCIIMNYPIILIDKEKLYIYRIVKIKNYLKIFL